MATTKINKVVLAYSGGLDTSIIIPWLKETYDCKVVAYIADVGQGDDYEYLKKKAIKSGADKVVVDDLREEFIREYVYPMIKSGAVYENKYLLGTSIARPVIAKGQMLCAKRENADAVSHGATGKGNDQVRFELGYMLIDPSITVIAAWKDPHWTLKSREECVAYAKSRNIPITTTKENPYSIDKNLWHTSFEGGVLEDPNNAAPDVMYDMITPLMETPDEATELSIMFEQGVPVSVDGEKMDPVAMLEKLNKIAGAHAVGRIDMVENRLVGIKSRGVYETPGGTLLMAAHRELEQLVLDRDTMHYKDEIGLRYAELVYYGQWFSDLREALDAFINKTQELVSGNVKIKVYKGNIIMMGKTSPHSRYSEELATFEEDEVYDQTDAAGFIKLFGLPMRRK